MVEDLTLILDVATVDNRYATARSCLTGSVFFLCLRTFLLLALEIVLAKGIFASGVFALFVLSLSTALTAPARTVPAALEVIVAEGVLLLLLFHLLTAVVGVSGFFTEFLDTFVGKVNNYHHDDGEGDKTKKDSGK